MRWIFLLISLCAYAASSPDWQLEVQSIDQKINQLNNMKEELRMGVEKKANEAMRWQFQHENYLDARRAWDELAIKKEQMKEVQAQIDKLEARKQEILKEHAR